VGKSNTTKLEDNVSDEIKRIIQLEKQVRLLSQRLREANEGILNSQTLLDFVHGTKDVSFEGAPDWLEKKSKNLHVTGIPVLFLSDIHFDEYVDPAQIEYCNKYSRDIAIERIKYTFATAISFCMERMNKPIYEGIVCALGGDLLSGNIHEELAETNEAPILESAVVLTEILIQGLTALADAFGKVFVPCVVGNHGRLHRKPRAKNRIKDNYEWLIYHNIARHFADDPRLTFMIPEGADALFSIYDKTFLLTHGDQFKGGAGISGIFTPLMLGFSRKQKRQQAVGKAFDVMMMGHWHQYIHTDNLIVNGSIKGYDEYAYIMNFGFENPQQSLFICHPTYGITFRMPVICNGYELKTTPAKQAIKIWAKS